MLAEQILSLNLTTRKICKNCENGTVISQKMRLLYLLRNDVLSPKDLVGDLSIAKPNLTILARNMVAEGLIEKLRVENDMRAVNYKITEKGKEELNRMILELNEYIVGRLDAATELSEGEKSLEAALSFLSGVK
ncbi:MAG: winged helix-turn-helix transcriptional regulator [Clostridiales bacterium]|nr:winged helix-turn-helix transcriptional regulator [Clostridiales bacterium]